MNIPPAVRRCHECWYSESAGFTTKLVCVEPLVNEPTAAFLAGVNAVARSCLLERGSRRGVCGPAGLRWRPRDPFGALPDA